ncbi:MAG: class IV adenylate cyclase [Promethearchaeota archaeon]
MIEIEIKAKISNPELLRKQIKKYNGIYKISLFHEDTYFNMPKGLRDFKKTDEALRLRKSIEFNKNNNEINQEVVYFLTYKGRKIDDATKTRKELEVKIENLDKMRELLNNLGFKEIFTIKKERELYKFVFKNFHIDALIDYIPILNQHFLEVEVLSDTLNNIEFIKNILFEFLEHFGISKQESIRESYLELIAKKLNLS